MVGREWLPDDTYLVRSDDGSGTPLVDVAGAEDPPRRSRRCATASARPASPQLPLRALQDTQIGRAVTLEWEAESGAATWGASGLANAGGPQPASASEIRLALANATASPGPGGQAPGGLDPLVVVTSADGVTVALPLEVDLGRPAAAAHCAARQERPPRHAVEHLETCDLSLRSPAEVVVQSYRIPLSAFSVADPAFVPSRLGGPDPPDLEGASGTSRGGRVRPGGGTVTVAVATR